MSGGRWRRLFRIAVFRRDARRELDDELDFHFRKTVEGLAAQGWSEVDAEREARRRFGDATRYRKELERIEKGRMRMEGWTMWASDRWADVRLSVRGMRRQPGFTAAVVITFALGIGANAALFGIVDRLLLRPPVHVREPGQVVRLQVTRDFLGRQVTTQSLAWDDYQDFKKVSGFQATGAFSSFSLTLGEGEGARRIHAMYADADFFPMLGVRAHLGRLYGPDDDRFGAPLVVVLGYELWRSDFGGDPGVLGTTVRIAGHPYTVVGIAPRGFTGLDLARVDAWIPMRPGKVATDGSDVWFSGRGWSFVRAAARLAPGVPLDVSLEQATAFHRAGHQENIEEGRYDPNAQVVANPLMAAFGPHAPPEGKVAFWLGGVSLLVLLIACANVTNLLLARSLRQRRESAVRLALGISPWRLVEQRVLDTVLLSLSGGLAGLAVAWWGGSALRERLLPNIDWTGASDTRVLVFAGVLSVAAGIVAAAAPAVLASRQGLSGALAQGGRGSAAGARLRGGLTLGQAALATVLLVGAGLFIRSMATAQSSDLGFDVDRIVQVELEPSARLEGEELVAYYRQAVERLEAMPQVEAAAATIAPFGWSFGGSTRAEGLDSIPRNPAGGPYYHLVSEHYFDAMGFRVRRGRALEDADAGGAPVAVINETMAALLWPDEDPLGRCLYRGSVEDDPPCLTIVGVIEDPRRGNLVEIPSPQYYTLRSDGGPDPRGIFVRVVGEPDAVAPQLSRFLSAELPNLRLARVRTMRDLLDPEFRGWRLGMTVFTLFGVLALLVAGVGLYSLLAFDVAERRREIGIRLALGAATRRIRGGVLTRALALAGAGVALGLAVAFALAPRAADLLYQVDPRDPAVFAVAAAVLLMAAGAAGLLPAFRATRVQPTEALRVE